MDNVLLSNYFYHIMNKKQKINSPTSCISMDVITYRTGKEFLKDAPPDEKHHILLRKMELMTYNDFFIEEVLEIREEFGIPKEGFDDFKVCYEWAQKITPSDDMKYIDCLDILFEHSKIKYRWKNIVGYFILFDNIDAPHLLPRSVEIEIKPTPRGEQEVYIKVQPETTLEDVKNWWTVVKMWQGLATSIEENPINFDPKSPEYLKSKDNPNLIDDIRKQASKKERLSKMITKYKKAYDLQKQGKSIQKITEIMNTNKNKEDIYGYEDINDFIRQFKNAVKNNKLD